MPTYPLINGQEFEFSHAELKVAGNIIVGLKSINFKEELKPTLVYGAHAQPLSMTRGVYTPEASLELYLTASKELREALAGAGTSGYGEVSFDVVANFSASGQDTITVELIGCRITAIDNAHSQGADALTEKVDVQPLYIKRNGQQMVAAPLVP